MIPNHGIQTQKIPPKTSVSERSVKSAAGKYFAFEEYKTNAVQTKNPCSVESEVFFKDIRKLLSLKIKISVQTTIDGVQTELEDSAKVIIIPKSLENINNVTSLESSFDGDDTYSMRQGENKCLISLPLLLFFKF